MWDKIHEDPRKHAKFGNLWLGPFVIKESIGLLPDTFHLTNMEGKLLEYLSMETI